VNGFDPAFFTPAFSAGVWGPKAPPAPLVPLAYGEPLAARRIVAAFDARPVRGDDGSIVEIYAGGWH